MKYYELQGVKTNSFRKGNLTELSKKVLNLVNKHNFNPEIGGCDEVGSFNPQKRCYDNTYWSPRLPKRYEYDEEIGKIPIGDFYAQANDILLTDADTVLVSERLKKVLEKSDIEGIVFIPADTLGDIENLPIKEITNNERTR